MRNNELQRLFMQDNEHERAAASVVPRLNIFIWPNGAPPSAQCARFCNRHPPQVQYCHSPLIFSNFMP